jgi:uncharacterized protein
VGTRREESRAGRIGELTVADSKVPAGSTARIVATLDSVDGGIEVTGVVAAPWTGECRRCLKPLSGELRCEVREVYRQRAEGEPPDDDEETYPLVGEQLDLQPLVRDALLLELPIAPLCREDCQGLCSRCGADLNDGPCGCEEPAGDPRWGVLEVLRHTEDEPAPIADRRSADGDDRGLGAGETSPVEGGHAGTRGTA